MECLETGVLCPNARWWRTQALRRLLAQRRLWGRELLQEDCQEALLLRGPQATEALENVLEHVQALALHLGGRCLQPHSIRGYLQEFEGEKGGGNRNLTTPILSQERISPFCRNKQQELQRIQRNQLDFPPVS